MALPAGKDPVVVLLPYVEVGWLYVPLKVVAPPLNSYPVLAVAVKPNALVLNEVPCGPLSGELEVIVYPDPGPPILLFILKVSFTFPGGAGTDTLPVRF